MRIFWAVVVPACLAVSGAALDNTHAMRARGRGTSRSQRARNGGGAYQPFDAVLSLIVPNAHAEDVVATRNDSTFTLEIRFMSRERANEACRALGVWGNKPLPRNYVGGCNMVYVERNPKHCVVIVPEPQQVDDMATTVLGHEVLHCAKGSYHQ